MSLRSSAMVTETRPLPGLVEKSALRRRRPRARRGRSSSGGEVLTGGRPLRCRANRWGRVLRLAHRSVRAVTARVEVADGQAVDIEEGDGSAGFEEVCHRRCVQGMAADDKEVLHRLERVTPDGAPVCDDRSCVVALMCPRSRRRGARVPSLSFDHSEMNIGLFLVMKASIGRDTA